MSSDNEFEDFPWWLDAMLYLMYGWFLLVVAYDGVTTLLR